MSSLPQIRMDLKRVLATETNAKTRAELARALKAIERAESKTLDSARQSC